MPSMERRVEAIISQANVRILTDNGYLGGDSVIGDMLSIFTVSVSILGFSHCTSAFWLSVNNAYLISN